MKHFFVLLAVLVLALSLVGYSQVPNKISYQGLLTTSGGTPVTDGSYDLKFEIHNLPSGGTLRHSETQTAVSVQRGTFNVILGTSTPLTLAFNESLYVEVTAVSGPAGPSYPLIFSPRSELTSAPYALQSVSLLGPNSIATGTAANAGGSNNRARGAYSVVSGGGGANAADSNSVLGAYSTVGGGSQNTASADQATVGGGISNSAIAVAATVGGGSGNNATGIAATVSGGFVNTASVSRATVGGGENNTASNTYATVGGGFSNTASGNQATVGGGDRNTATNNWATVGGGYSNTASNTYATVGGGRENSASSLYATVGGGGNNLANAPSSVVGGGYGNAASGNSATVSGGAFNTASGQNSTVPGGYSNNASGNNSLAAGRRAKASHLGSFVWADSTVDADFASTGNNQFLIRASGGVGIGTTSPTTASGGQVLHINNASGASAVRLGDDAANGIQWELQSTVIGGAGALNISNIDSFTNPITILANGYVGVGSVGPSEKLAVAGNICATGTIGVCSDARYKTNLREIPDALNKVKSLNGVFFNWKREEFPVMDFNAGNQIGFVAQELKQVLPEAVSLGSDGYYSVDYGRLTPLLVEAIKEQQKEIKELRAMIKSLSAEKSDGEKSLGELK